MQRTFVNPAPQTIGIIRILENIYSSIAGFRRVIKLQASRPEANSNVRDLSNPSDFVGNSAFQPRRREGDCSELAAIVDSSDDVILSKDLNGIITSWNAAATRLFGYSADEMIGTSILKLIPEDLHSDEKAIMENVRAGRRVEHFETVRRTKSGQLLDVSLTVSPIRDKHVGLSARPRLSAISSRANVLNKPCCRQKRLRQPAAWRPRSPMKSTTLSKSR